MKAYVYELHSESDGKLATVWWDGKKVKSDKPFWLENIKSLNIMGTTYLDGPEFLSNLPNHYKNGYIFVRRVG